jgi:hypothetical protein
MTVSTHITAVGVFQEPRQAQRAIDQLRRQGFEPDRIGVVGPGTGPGGHAREGALAGVAAGAGLGGLWAIGIAAGVLPAIGPVIAGGVLASVLASAAGGAVAGGLVGSLVGIGVQEEEANYYEGQLESGRTIVVVQADDRYAEARAVLDRYGSHDWATRDHKWS